MTILAVSDLPAAARFYERAFELAPVVAVPVYREYALPGGQRLGLYQREVFGHNTGQVPAQVPAGELTATELYWWVDGEADLEPWLARLTAAGARLLSAKAPRPWGDEAAYFADPEGNVLVVARPLQGPPVAPGEALRALARRWLALWNEGTARFDELHAAAFVDHSPAERGADRAAFRAGIEDLRRAFPDLVVREEALVVEIETSLVAVRWSGRGTHRGGFYGHQPTGRVVQLAGLELVRVEGGQITERWGHWDGESLRQQLAE